MNEYVTPAFGWIGELDHNKVVALRLAVQNHYIYEDPCVNWGVQLQFLAHSDDKNEDVVTQWWNYLVIAKFRIKEWAITYANHLTEEEVLTFVKLMDDDSSVSSIIEEKA